MVFTVSVSFDCHMFNKHYSHLFLDPGGNTHNRTAWVWKTNKKMISFLLLKLGNLHNWVKRIRPSQSGQKRRLELRCPTFWRHRDVIFILSCFSILSSKCAPQHLRNMCASKCHINVNRTTEPHDAKVCHSPTVSEQQLPAFLFSFGASDLGKDRILNISFDPLPTWSNWDWKVYIVWYKQQRATGLLLVNSLFIDFFFLFI